MIKEYSVFLRMELFSYGNGMRLNLNNLKNYLILKNLKWEKGLKQAQSQMSTFLFHLTTKYTQKEKK